MSISDGSQGLMVNKCCYFVRNVAAGVALDMTKSGENDLLFGELGDSALGTIESILSQSYKPMLNTYDSWGKVDEEHRSDFVSRLNNLGIPMREGYSPPLHRVFNVPDVHPVAENLEDKELMTFDVCSYSPTKRQRKTMREIFRKVGDSLK